MIGAACRRVESGALWTGFRPRISASMAMPTPAPIAPIFNIGPTSSRQFRQGSIRVHRNSPEATPTPAPINAPFSNESDWRTLAACCGKRGSCGVCAQAGEPTAIENKAISTTHFSLIDIPFARMVLRASTPYCARRAKTGSLLSGLIHSQVQDGDTEFWRSRSKDKEAKTKSFSFSFSFLFFLRAPSPCLRVALGFTGALLSVEQFVDDPAGAVDVAGDHQREANVRGERASAVGKSAHGVSNERL